MKKLLAILLCVLLLCSLVACGKTEDAGVSEEEDPLTGAEVLVKVEGADRFTYEANEDGKYDIVGFSSTNNAPHAITVPDVIDNIEITGIADDAFKACNQISEVTIPNTVKHIGNYAFFSCQYLTKVTMANSVTEVGEGAFQACVSLTDVTLSAELTEIAPSLFLDCVSLATVSIPEKVTAIGALAFARCVALTEVVLPAGVKSIGDAAFSGCSALAKATVPDTVETLGKEIFSKCAEGFTLMGEIGEKSKLYAYARELGYALEGDAPAVEEGATTTDPSAGAATSAPTGDGSDGTAQA